MSCDFCFRAIDKVELLFRAHTACRISICAECVLWFAEIIVTHRASPALAASLIEAHNTVADRHREEARG